MNIMLDAIGFFKASNSEENDRFGRIALSADGNTLAVGAVWEDSNATGIDGDQNDNTARNAGAVYVFRFDGTDWSQQAYLKASNSDPGDHFGTSVALSADGRVLVVGAPGEGSLSRGLGGDQDDNSQPTAGAVYLFEFDNESWKQVEYVKASNTVLIISEGDNANFGYAVSVSDDGATFAVGALSEHGASTGINGDQFRMTTRCGGAAYIFEKVSAGWLQTAYVKAIDITTFCGEFGAALSLSGDGTALVVYGELSAYSYRKAGSEWFVHEKLGAAAEFALDLDKSGTTLVLGQSLSQTVLVFKFDGESWIENAQISASIADLADNFGGSVAISGDGLYIAVGAPNEDSGSGGVNGDQFDNSVEESGAVYLFQLIDSIWVQVGFVKAPQPGEQDKFGSILGLSIDGATLAVGVPGEDSSDSGIGGNQNDNSAERAGAAYLF